MKKQSNDIETESQYALTLVITEPINFLCNLLWEDVFLLINEIYSHRRVVLCSPLPLHLRFRMIHVRCCGAGWGWWMKERNNIARDIQS